MRFVESEGATPIRRRRGVPVALLLGACLALVTGCSQGPSTGAAAAPAGTSNVAAGRGSGRGSAVAVTTATAQTKPMAVRVRVVGTVEPASSVSVRAQVQGELLKVHFTEGQDVNAGDLLFTVD